MMPHMNFTRRKRRWPHFACRWVAIMVLAMAPATAMAQRSDADEHEIYDARVEGYAGNKTLPGGGTAIPWIAFIFLSIVALAGLFKDAKRTHLD
ncbi:MAG: hypothetical protein QOF78_1478 [Phycisphaerales bacterium]|jgi:hypothetical protein|nr:hypothetical protein [Phycisphaerales bacterium]